MTLSILCDLGRNCVVPNVFSELVLDLHCKVSIVVFYSFHLNTGDFCGYFDELLQTECSLMWIILNLSSSGIHNLTMLLNNYLQVCWRLVEFEFRSSNVEAFQWALKPTCKVTNDVKIVFFLFHLLLKFLPSKQWV